LVIEGLKNLDSPNRTGTFVISHAAHPATTSGSGLTSNNSDEPIGEEPLFSKFKGNLNERL